MPKRDLSLSHGELLFARFLYGLRIATHHGQAPWLSDRRGPDSLSFSRMKCSLSQNAYPHARIESRQKPITLPGSAVSGLIVRTVNWRNIASLTMWIPVKHFLSALTRALRRARHFALVEGSAITNQGPLVIVSGLKLSSTHASLRSHLRS